MSEDFESINSFRKEYFSIFPGEAQVPDNKMITVLRIMADHIIESSGNLLYIKKKGLKYDVIAHWCLANKTYEMSTNIKIFSECKTLLIDLNKTGDIIMENMNPAYAKLLTRTLSGELKFTKKSNR